MSGSRRWPNIVPLAPERYKVQFTASAETYKKPRLAQDLLRHQIPDGDPAEIFDRALTALLGDLTKKKFAATHRPRESSDHSNGSRHIPAEVKRAVLLRDGGRCAFVGPPAAAVPSKDSSSFIMSHHNHLRLDGTRYACAVNIEISGYQFLFSPCASMMFDSPTYQGTTVPKLVIFDCDGVLVDSERIAVRVDAVVLSKLGWVLTEDEIVDRFVGRPHEFMVAEIEAHLGQRLPPDWEDQYLHLYREAFQANLSPVDGVLEALEEIPVLTCVASSGSHEKMRYTLSLVGLYERFAGRIFSASDVARGKPAPDLFLHAAARMGVAPEECKTKFPPVGGTYRLYAAGECCILRGRRPVAGEEFEHRPPGTSQTEYGGGHAKSYAMNEVSSLFSSSLVTSDRSFTVSTDRQYERDL